MRADFDGLKIFFNDPILSPHLDSGLMEGLSSRKWLK